ncbi:MAG: cyclase family protein [Terriglobia bacterium]
MKNTAALCEALKEAKLIDLSQTLEEHMPHFPTHSKFFHNLWSSYAYGDRSLSYELLLHEHHGTHVDAPAHFIGPANPQARVTIDRVPLERLIGRGVRIDCREFHEGQSVSAEFVMAWEANHGPIEAEDIVLFNFGWDARWALRPNFTPYVADWPAVSTDAAQVLLEKRIAAIGVDTLSPDSPEALRGKPIHPIVLEKQVLIIENLRHLDQLPDFFLFLALPLKIRDGSGSPVRAVALC